MKHSLFFHFIALVCALMTVTALQAQDSNVYCPSGKYDPNVIHFNSFDQMDQMETLNQVKQIPRKAEGETCTLTINLEFDADLFYKPDVVVYNQENMNDAYGFYFDNNASSEQQTLSLGTYDIFAQFRHISTGTYYTIIKESVEISSDMTMTLNPEEATNHIAFRTYGPDGVLLKHSLGYRDSESGQWVTTEEGTIKTTHFANVIFKKLPNALHFIQSNTYHTIGDASSPEGQIVSQMDYYVNDVSDNFLFTQYRYDIKDRNEYEKLTAYCNYYSTDNVKIGVIENNPANYVFQSDTYKFSPYGRTQNGFGFGKTHIKVLNNMFYQSNANDEYINVPKEGDSFTIDTYLNIPDVDPTFSNLKLLNQNEYMDYGGSVVNQWGFEQIKPLGWSNSAASTIKNGSVISTNIGNHNICAQQGSSRNDLYNVYVDLFGTGDESFRIQLLPSPEAFTYPAEQALGILGDNCPINALKVKCYENQGRMNLTFNSYYVGRYGETRWCNNETTTATMKFNGTDVDPSTFTPDDTGTIEYSITNTNVDVDGVAGHNTTTVYFNQNKEDMTPPSIEMLHFKNSDDGVTDRFATPDEGIIEFYASDFHYQYYPERFGGIFECKPVDVVVEYAPYGTEDWTELAVTEVPELFQSPGFGYFYRGSLSDVTGVAEQGWFDLRFRLTDEVGNWQEQVVSPAFRIDEFNQTAITEVSNDRKSNYNSIYNISGQRVYGDLNSLPHGVYIIGGKKVVK